MDKKNKILFNAWNEHLNNTRDRTNYAIRRLDLLIISISGAGIYIIFETIREFKTGNVIIDNPKLLMWSGIAFLIAIALNFVSQLTGYYANNYEEKYTIIQLSKIEGKKYSKKNKKKYNSYSKRFTLTTDILNAFSMLLMFVGLILLALFNYRFF